MTDLEIIKALYNGWHLSDIERERARIIVYGLKQNLDGRVS